VRPCLAGSENRTGCRAASGLTQSTTTQSPNVCAGSAGHCVLSRTLRVRRHPGDYQCGPGNRIHSSSDESSIVSGGYRTLPSHFMRCALSGRRDRVAHGERGPITPTGVIGF
jgi:hypothetical protein